MGNKLKIATCQFPVSENITKNSKFIQKQIRTAAANDADLIHFSETALSGYAGVDFDSFDNFDWELLEKETKKICNLAKELNVWIALGTTSWNDKNFRPKNCVYFISSKGEIVKEYDKCTFTKNDIKFYSHGDPSTIMPVNINGINIGILICYDSSYQEMFEKYKQDNVSVLLLSSYNAKNKGPGFVDEITPAIILTRAVDNSMWIMANNSSVKYSNWPTSIASPEGRIVQKLPRHKSGILYHEFPDENYKKWRIKYT